MFAAAYLSRWQQMGTALVAAGPILVVALVGARVASARRRWFRLLLVLELVVVADTLTNAWLVPRLSGLAATLAASLFVVAGDLRFFYLVARQRAPASPSRALAVALPVALLVPLGTGVAALLVASLTDNRLFLLYEGLMVPLVVAFTWPRRRSVYARRLLVVELAQYATWALADAMILGGHDSGWLVRMVANAIYYVGWAPLATLATPADARV